MKRCNREADMKPDDFEQKLSRQPLRPVPPEWRAEILRAARPQAAAPVRPRLCDYLALLLWPSPRAWGALAAAWVVIVAANLAMNSGGPGRAASPAPMAGVSWRQQQRLMAELLNGAEVPERAKEPKVSPRSERVNPKSEYRNPKEVRNSNSELDSMLAHNQACHANPPHMSPGALPSDGSGLIYPMNGAVTCTHSGFGIRNSFGIRVSDFGPSITATTEENFYG
jgi:hypothetical protein